jgi:hypothetical protein
MPNKKEDKNIDVELLVFYLGFSILCFILYLIRHPILLAFYNNNSFSDLIYAFILDLFIFLSIFIPYIIFVIILIIIKLVKKVKIPDNIFVILFFPIFSFFTKGMSLLQVYVYSNIFEIFKDNFSFYLFLLIGPVIVILNKFVIILHNKVFQKNI